jgi:hypothetical protein
LQRQRSSSQRNATAAVLYLPQAQRAAPTQTSNHSFVSNSLNVVPTTDGTHFVQNMRSCCRRIAPLFAAMAFATARLAATTKLKEL